MPVVKINAISVPPQAHEELEKRFANRAHTVDGTPGFLGFQLLRPVAGEELYGVSRVPGDGDERQGGVHGRVEPRGVADPSGARP